MGSVSVHSRCLRITYIQDANYTPVRLTFNYIPECEALCSFPHHGRVQHALKWIMSRVIRRDMKSPETREFSNETQKHQKVWNLDSAQALDDFCRKKGL